MFSWDVGIYSTMQGYVYECVCTHIDEDDYTAIYLKIIFILQTIIILLGYQKD